MKYDFEIDVTGLLTVVEREDLLFYPVMIHLLMQALRKNSLCQCSHHISYRQKISDTQSVIFQHHWQADFDSFFEDYVKTFYNFNENEHCDPEEGNISEDNIHFTFFDNSIMPAKCDMTLCLKEFICTDNQVILPITLETKKKISDIAELIDTCQNLCNNFTSGKL